MDNNPTTLKIATWNVNSIRTREQHLVRYLEKSSPDAICLQEIKGEDAVFPRQTFEALGYSAALFGQKSYNGVALLSRLPMLEIERGFGDPAFDREARLISATIAGVRVVSAYIPQGSEIGSEKWDWKLRFLDRLIEYVKSALEKFPRFCLCGDFNIAPGDLDVWDVKRWANTVVTADEVRVRFQELCKLGLSDARRKDLAGQQEFSWWDYRHDSFNKGRGLRIDFTLLSPELSEHQAATGIDSYMRQEERPSDHAPSWVTLENL